MNRGLKIAGIVIAVLLLIIIALPFVVDVNHFRPTLEAELSTALGRQVKVGNLKLSILSGAVSAEDLSIADDPAFGKDPFVRAKALNVGVEVWPLILSKTLHITDLTLDRPDIVLIKNAAGQWNFSTLGNASGSAKSPSKPAGDTKPTDASSNSLSVSQFDVKDGRLTVTRMNSQAKPHVYDKVNLQVRNFSYTSQFPFTLTAQLPAGGTVKLDGKAGPFNQTDVSLSPLQAQVTVKQFDVAASGFVESSTGIAGILDFDGTIASDGSKMHTAGTLTANKLKLAEKGAAADRPVSVKYSLDHDMQKDSGTISQGDIAMGKALAQLTGGYRIEGPNTLLNMKLIGQGMPVDELVAMLPALGVVLPSGSKLQGGSLSLTLGITGPVDKLVITGPVRLKDTKLAGFNLGSKLSAISKFTGGGGGASGSDTSIQNLSTDARVAPEGIRTENVNLTIPALGVVTGNGTISPGGALNYKMNAALSGGAVSGITQMAGLGSKGANLPFFIQGTTSNPQIVPDAQGILSDQLKSRIPGNDQTKGLVDSLSGLFGKKKKNK